MNQLTESFVCSREHETRVNLRTSSEHGCGGQAALMSRQVAMSEWSSSKVRELGGSAVALSAVCVMGDEPVIEYFDDLQTDAFGVLWHDHSGRGGDIVCAGPFTLVRGDSR